MIDNGDGGFTRDEVLALDEHYRREQEAALKPLLERHARILDEFQALYDKLAAMMSEDFSDGQ